MNSSNLREIFRLPKWAKIVLFVLSVIAIALLVSAFALQKWADSQIESANLTLSKIDKAKSAELSGESKSESSGESQIYAYEARVHFSRLDFLLRSKSISNIDLQSVDWANGIDSSAIQSIETHNRRLNFTTTQKLDFDSGENLGAMSFKMDFSTLPKGIAKYYVLIMIFASIALFFSNVFKNEIARFLNMLNQDSLPQAIWQSYKNINPLYRHTFWIVFIACNVVFGFDSAQFLWGKESWGATFGNIGGNWAITQGRWSQNAIVPLLTQDLVLPFLNNMLSFFALSVASILLCAYLNITRKVWIWAIIGLILTLSPFTLSRMYFTYQVAGLFIAVAIGILGFVLAKKAGESNPNHLNNSGVGNSLSLSRSRVKSYTLCFLSIICIHWGIASYQPFIDTALILLCGGIIAIIIENKGDLKLSFYKSRFLILSVALAGISYKIALDIMRKLGKVQEVYNNQMIAFSEMPERILLAIKMAFKSLFAYNVPFMPEFIAILFGVFVGVLLILFASSQLKLSTKCGIIIVLFGLILASQTHIALSKNISTGIVTDFYGVLFLRVVLVALVFKLIAESKKAQTLWQNLTFALSCVVVWACVIQSLNAQKIQKLSIDNAFHYINRVVDRIEQSPNFSYEQKYCGIMFGEPKVMKDFLGFTLFPWWDMKSVFANTMSKNVFEGCNVYGDTIQMREDSDPKELKVFYNIIKRLHKAGILDTLEPYPHKNSVVVFEDIIVFVASKGNLDEIRKAVKELQ